MRPSIKRNVESLFFLVVICVIVITAGWVTALPHLWLYSLEKKNHAEIQAVNHLIENMHREIRENLF